jgi:hypothetical protein
VATRRGRRLRAALACIAGLCLALPAMAGAAAPSLYERVKGAASCEQSEGNGRYCEYKLDGVFEIGIKDVGGEHTVVGFRHSNVDAELYAVLYGGCVAIVPGKSNKTAHHRDYGVFISPKDGMVYRTSVQCEGSLK